MTKIWTLNARDTVLFDVMMSHSGLSFADLGPEIRAVHAEVVQMLASKGVRYEDLRSALVPHTDPELADIALVFDTSRVDSGAYGLAIAERVLPLVDRDWNGSILEGDLIHPDEDDAFLTLQRSLRCVRPADISSTRQLFTIYLTNLNERRKVQVLTGLLEYEPFIGFMEAHYESRHKNWLSVTLGNTYVKHGDTFIGRHEPDIEHAAEYNLGWWPLEDYGYRCVSLPSDLHFDPFLSYKIERAIFPGFESDTLHGLSTISVDPQSLDDFRVFVDPPKVDYLRKMKAGSLDVAGLTEVTAQELERQIGTKVQQNYIYALEQRVEHSLSKFNVILEFEVDGRDRPVKLMAALAYESEARRLRLLTMF
ncbi:MAG TPA: hypothetical protein VNA57_01920 [Acidimicrobiales bacterium]|nr:hypothetical protein [Acidimicrobiales bacterium]